MGRNTSGVKYSGLPQTVIFILNRISNNSIKTLQIYWPFQLPGRDILSKSEEIEGSYRQFFLRVSPFLQLTFLYFLENQFLLL